MANVAMDVDINELNLPAEMRKLCEDYLKYGAVVVTSRAVPAIDGLKPCARRIIYTLAKEKAYTLQKSADIVGSVMRLHPHGDGSIYAVLAAMVALGEAPTFSWAYSPIFGKGSFGRAFSTGTPSASRYTNVCLAESVKDMWVGDMQGVNFVPAYDGIKMEPDLLPVRFPTILCNGTTGMAVGMATKIPSFNLKDVIDATIEYIQTGKIETLVIPDYPTGGVLLYDESTIQSIKKTGKGTLRFRASYEIDDKDIIFSEMPPYVKVEAVIDKIRELQLDGVREVRNGCDRLNLCRLVVSCKSKGRVEEVLAELMSSTDLVTTFSANMNVIVDGRPEVCGVDKLIRYWVDFRRGVVVKQLSYELDGYIEQYTRVCILLKVLADGVLERFNKALLKSEEDATNIILEVAPEATIQQIDWILDMKLRSLSNRDRRVREAESLKLKIDGLTNQIKNKDDYIVNELREILSVLYLGRCTELEMSSKYGVAKSSVRRAKDVVVDTSNYLVTITSDLVLTKHSIVTGSHSQDCVFKESMNAQGVVLLADSDGVAYRCYLSEIAADTPVYLPRYFGLTELNLCFIESLDGPETNLMYYADGTMSVFNRSDFITSKRNKIVTRGFTDCGSIQGIIADITNVYALCCTTVLKRKAILLISDIHLPKSRLSKSRLVRLAKGDEIEDMVPMTKEEVTLGLVNGDLRQYIGVVPRLYI